jgi:hypothetical protein
MKLEFRFDTVATNRLIQIRHSEYYIQKFADVEGKPNKMKEVWEELAREMGSNFHAKDVKSKYNCLYSQYKLFLDESKRSGSGSPAWKYWTIFNETASHKIKNSTMENVEDVGIEMVMPRNSIKNEVIKTQKENLKRKPSISNKEKYYEKVISLIDMELRKSQCVEGKLEKTNEIKTLKQEIIVLNRKHEEIAKNVEDLKNDVSVMLGILHGMKDK